MSPTAIFRLEDDDAAANVTSTDLTKGEIFIGDFHDYCEQKGSDVVKDEMKALVALLGKMATSKSYAVNRGDWIETDESRWSLLKNAFTENSMALRYLIHAPKLEKKAMVELICGMSPQNMKSLCRLFLDIFQLPFRVFEACLKRISLKLTFSSFYFFLINLCSSLESESNGSCVFIDFNLVKDKNIKPRGCYWELSANTCRFKVHRAFGILNYAQFLLDKGLYADIVCHVLEYTNDKYRINRNESFTGSHMCHQATCVDKKCMFFEKLSVNQARNVCKNSEDPINLECPFEPKCLVHSPEFTKRIKSIETSSNQKENLNAGADNRVAILETENHDLKETLAEESKLRVETEKKLTKESKLRVETEKKLAEESKLRVETEKKLAEESKLRVETEKKLADVCSQFENLFRASQNYDSKVQDLMRQLNESIAAKSDDSQMWP